MFEYDESFDAIYWGTPTIVDDKPLFPDSLEPGVGHSWDKIRERATSTQLAKLAVEQKAKRIITGLGSGDISWKERLMDMGGGRIVSWKDFGDFEDWVLVRDI